MVLNNPLFYSHAHEAMYYPFEFHIIPAPNPLSTDANYITNIINPLFQINNSDSCFYYL